MLEENYKRSSLKLFRATSAPYIFVSLGGTLQEFGQHGRELVTSEVALRLLQTLGGEYPLENVDIAALYRVLPHTTIKVRAKLVTDYNNFPDK
jgi:hypothetical protein